jgi:hypothetical protein
VFGFSRRRKLYHLAAAVLLVRRFPHKIVRLESCYEAAHGSVRNTFCISQLPYRKRFLIG